MDKNLFFQYCPKFVIFDNTFDNILLCKRKGEQDFNNMYGFPGGKIECSDGSVWEGVKREKNEELGSLSKIILYKNLVHFEYYIKQNGSHMILPHHFCIYHGGEIIINHEYSSYKWFKIEQLSDVTNLITTVLPIVNKIKEYKSINILDSIDSVLL